MSNFTTVNANITTSTMNQTSDSLTGDMARTRNVFMKVYATISAVTIILNVAVVILFCCLHKKRKRIIPNVVLLFQAFSDIVIGVYLVLRAVLKSFDFSVPYDFESYQTIAMLSTVFTQYTHFLSITVLLVGSLERFVAICFPFQRQRYVTRSRVIIVLIFTFILCTIPAILYRYYVEKETMKHFVIPTYTIYLTEVLVVNILLLLSYAKIKRSIKDHINNQQSMSEISHQGGNTAREEVIRAEEKRNKRCFRIFMFMCTTYAITFIPTFAFRVYFWSAPPANMNEVFTKTIIADSFFLECQLAVMEE